jgi:hypothetical protein
MSRRTRCASTAPKWRGRGRHGTSGIASWIRFTIIDALIESTPKITARRIGAIIKQQHDSTFSISASALRKYVAGQRCELVPKEAFVRAQHLPADQAQFDFSPMTVLIAGVLTVVQVFAMRLSYSGIRDRLTDRLCSGFHGHYRRRKTVKSRA